LHNGSGQIGSGSCDLLPLRGRAIYSLLLGRRPILPAESSQAHSLLPRLTHSGQFSLLDTRSNHENDLLWTKRSAYRGSGTMSRPRNPVKPFATGSVLRRIAGLSLNRIECDVLKAMATRADYRSGIVPASHRDIAADLGRHPSTVSRTRMALARRGVIVEVFRSGKMVQFRLGDVLSGASVARRANAPGPDLCSSEQTACLLNQQTNPAISQVRRAAATRSLQRRREKAQRWLSKWQRAAMSSCPWYHPLPPIERRAILQTYLTARLDDDRPKHRPFARAA
jgi:hypothetical protein